MIIDRGCIYHVMRVIDLEFETPSIELVPVVREFQKVLPDYLLRVPRE